MKHSKLDKKFFHRLFLLFIILLLPIFLIKEYRVITAKKDIRILPAQDFFQSQLLENNNKSFTFIVLTKNNIDVIDENFESILSQNYSQYQIIYIDQASTDGTPERLQELIQKKRGIHSISLIEAKQDYEAFQAYFDQIYALDNDEVVIHLSGSDFLAHEEVLDCLDQVYMNPDVWLTYGQYFDYYSYQKGIYEAKPQKTLFKKRVQRAPWLLASFKTFYAGHFKKIKRDESIEEYFLSIESEASLLLPLAELGKAHVQFIPDVLYIHSTRTKMKKRKMKLSSMTKKYTNSLPDALPLQPEEVDVILFSHNRPEELNKCLKSIQTNVQGIGQVSIIYQCDESYFLAYETIKKEHPEVIFFRPEYQGAPDFKSSFFRSLVGRTGGSSYVILSSDQTVVQEAFSLSPCIEAMRKSRAYGFYFHLGRFGLKESSKGIYSWVIGQGQDAWREPNNLKMALYRKVDLERDFKNASFNNVTELIMLWSKEEVTHHFGLSFDHAKIL